MAFYKVTLSRSAEKDLRKIDKSFIPKIIAQLESLGVNPRPYGVRKLVASDHTYRIRVGVYRIVYLTDDRIKTVAIGRIRHRKDAY